MILLAFFSALVGFFFVLFFTPWLIRYLRKIQLVVYDMNKAEKPRVPLSGGLVVLGGFLASMMIFIFLQTFFHTSRISFTLDPVALNFLFAGVISIMTICLVGFVDDLVVRRPDQSSGLQQWQKPLLTLFAAVPLMVVNAGTTVMAFPLLGKIDIGLLYPLFLIPLGVIGASNMVNMLAGYNGLEAGLGLIYFAQLGLYAYVNERYVATFFALAIFFSLLAFLFYNWNPAKILPGDSLTYLMGAGLAVIAILGNIEKAALIISLPFFAELFLKLRCKLNARSYGYCKGGTIHSYYKKIYSLPHLFARTGKYTETQIVVFLLLGELVISSLIWVL